MKKSTYLIAVVLGCLLAMPMIGYNLLTGPSAPSALGLNTLEPSAGDIPGAVADTPQPAMPPTAPRLMPAETTAADIIPSMKANPIEEAALLDQDSEEAPPLRITSDKPEVVQLSRDAVNILVGSDKNLRVVPDTNRTLILIPKQPGSTYFKALDNEGKVIMQRHVVVGSPKQDYIRIRRACVNGGDGCRQYSVYYCPDMCHEVSVSQDQTQVSPTVPGEAPNYRASRTQQSEGNQQDDTPVQDTLER